MLGTEVMVNPNKETGHCQHGKLYLVLNSCREAAKLISYSFVDNKYINDASINLLFYFFIHQVVVTTKICSQRWRVISCTLNSLTKLTYGIMKD
jgi:hypothetical protein